MAEKYGIQAKILESIAETPVSTQTCILFVGWAYNSEEGNTPHRCTSYKDYLNTFHPGEDKPFYSTGSQTITSGSTYFTPSGMEGHIQKIDFVKDAQGRAVNCYLGNDNRIYFSGTAPAGEITYGIYIRGLSLDDCAKCAFQVVGLESAWFVNVETEITDEKGDADTGELSYILPDVLDYIVSNSSDRPNIVCLGGPLGHTVAEQVSTYIDAAIGGKYSAMGIYNAEAKAQQTSENDAPVTSEIQSASRSGNMYCVWGTPTTGENPRETYLDGAAYVACILAKQDGKNIQNLPYRSVGNLDSPQIYSVVNMYEDTSSRFVYKACTCKQNDMNAVVENGIISFCNHGNRVFSTWGDHTSAVRAGDVDDEIYRFDTNIRMAIAINNRFIDKHKRSIDAPMTLRLRDCIINEQQDFLNGLVALGILVGSPTCKFTSSIDDIGKGYFYFENIFTGAIPAKYIELGTRYTTEGLSAYLEEA